MKLKEIVRKTKLSLASIALGGLSLFSTGCDPEEYAAFLEQMGYPMVQDTGLGNKTDYSARIITPIPRGTMVGNPDGWRLLSRSDPIHNHPIDIYGPKIPGQEQFRFNVHMPKSNPLGTSVQIEGLGSLASGAVRSFGIPLAFLSIIPNAGGGDPRIYQRNCFNYNDRNYGAQCK
ncbi:MAG: hypothetical protein Q7S74_05965 [Nanoarchaeota archaeon]|nr:hypothetical protein [Nanoarchaeota archaeon]